MVLGAEYLREWFLIMESITVFFNLKRFSESQNCPTLYAYYAEQIKLSAYTFIARTTDTWWLDLKLSTVRNHITIQNPKSFRMYENISFFQKKNACHWYTLHSKKNRADSTAVLGSPGHLKLPQNLFWQICPIDQKIWDIWKNTFIGCL